jgi:hypothetical protein
MGLVRRDEFRIPAGDAVPTTVLAEPLYPFVAALNVSPTPVCSHYELSSRSDRADV